MKSYVMLFSTVFLLAGCSDDNAKLKGEFIRGCLSGGADKAVCSCIYEKLEDKYGQEELLRINALSQAPAPFLEDGAQFAMQCVKSG